MVKRKSDCCLDEIIGEYFKKKKFEKSLKFLKEKVEQKTDLNKTLESLCDYLKKNVSEKANTDHEDLGFEINFGAYEPQQKVSWNKVCGVYVIVHF